MGPKGKLLMIKNEKFLTFHAKAVSWFQFVNKYNDSRKI